MFAPFFASAAFAPHLLSVAQSAEILPLPTKGAGFERDLYFGILNGPEVTRLQEFLKNQSVYDGPVTGNFLALTREGVKRFQSREGIEPAGGYFGPKTRARANDLLAGAVMTDEEIIARLKVQIAELQARLTELQERLKTEEAEENIPPAPPADTLAPVFTKEPYIKEEGFLNHPFPLGVNYPYRLVLDWSVDEKGFVEETVSCSPGLKILKPAGKNTEYYPDPHTDYECTVTVKDVAGNTASDSLKFTSPSWISFSGSRSAKFPTSVITPLKLGDFSIHNGSTTAIRLAQLRVKISDNMDSPLNRNREVILAIREGTTATGTVIGSEKFTFHSDPVKAGAEPHKYLVDLSFPELILPGNTKTVSLWIELLEQVLKGELKAELEKVFATVELNPHGGFTYVLKD